MGKYFDAYKNYYDNLDMSKVLEAKSLTEEISYTSSIISNAFNNIKNLTWYEQGKNFVFSIFDSIVNNINDLKSFVSDKLVLACQKADKLYLKVVEIKEEEERLEHKNNELSTFINNLESKKHQLSRLSSNDNKDALVKINYLKSQINNLQNSITSVLEDINNIAENLNILCGETNLLITEIMQLDGASLNAINDVINGINIPTTTTGFSVVLHDPFERFCFIKKPYSKYDRYGNILVVLLSNGKTFTVYQQSDTNNYHNKNWYYHVLNELGRDPKNTQPFKAGCSYWSLASAISYFLNIPGLDPGFTGGTSGMWCGTLDTLNGYVNSLNEAGNDNSPVMARIIDPETGEYNRYYLKTTGLYNTEDGRPLVIDYSGHTEGYNKELNELATPEKFKSDINATFEQGGCVILNSTAQGFTSTNADYAAKVEEAKKAGKPIPNPNQHFVTLMGTDENGYVIMADSMYDGRGPYKLNSLTYDPSLPYSENNCPPYLKYNPETGEPFKVDDLVDYLVDGAISSNSYLPLTNVELVYVEPEPIPEARMDDYNNLVQAANQTNYNVTDFFKK